MGVLVGEGEPDPEPAGLGEGVAEIGRQCQVVLELVQVDADGVAPFGGDVGTAQGLGPHAGQHERGEQRRDLGAEGALGAVDQQDPAAGEHLTDRELWCALAEHGPELRAQQERAQLVQERGDRLVAGGVGPRLECGPERLEGDGVVDVGEAAAPEPRVGEQQRERGEAHVRDSGERVQRVAEDVDGPVPEAGLAAVDAFEHGEELVGDHFRLAVAVGERVEPDDPGQVVRVDQHDVVDAVGGDLGEALADEVGLRFAYDDGTTGDHVRRNHPSGQRRLPRAAWAEEPSVAEGVFRRDRQRSFLARVGGSPHDAARGGNRPGGRQESGTLAGDRQMPSRLGGPRRQRGELRGVEAQREPPRDLGLRDGAGVAGPHPERHAGRFGAAERGEELADQLPLAGRADGTDTDAAGGLPSRFALLVAQRVADVGVDRDLAAHRAQGSVFEERVAGHRVEVGGHRRRAQRRAEHPDETQGLTMVEAGQGGEHRSADRHDLVGAQRTALGGDTHVDRPVDPKVGAGGELVNGQPGERGPELVGEVGSVPVRGGDAVDDPDAAADGFEDGRGPRCGGEKPGGGEDLVCGGVAGPAQLQPGEWDALHDADPRDDVEPFAFVPVDGAVVVVWVCWASSSAWAWARAIRVLATLRRSGGSRRICRTRMRRSPRWNVLLMFTSFLWVCVRASSRPYQWSCRWSPTRVRG